MSNVQSVISEFTVKLESAIRADAYAAVAAALGPNGRAKSTVAILREASETPPLPKPVVRKARKGASAKRTPEQIEATKTAIVASLAKTPNQSAEQIKKALKVDLATISLPIAKLLEQKRIKKTGQKRATRYTASKA